MLLHTILKTSGIEVFCENIRGDVFVHAVDQLLIPRKDSLNLIVTLVSKMNWQNQHLISMCAYLRSREFKKTPQMEASSGVSR